MKIIKSLRNQMKARGLDYLLISDTDPHFSEYVNEYYKFRTLVSGFTGSNGTLVLGLEDGYMFTDGRYFIQAENELKGTRISLMKLGIEGFPTLNQFILTLNEKGYRIGCLEDCISYAAYSKMPFIYLDNNYSIIFDAYREAFGEEYPQLQINKYIEILRDDVSGESVFEKINYVREELKKVNGDIYISSSLESNMWLLNIRGRAIEHNPVAYSYVVITKDETDLFLMGEISSDLLNVNVKPYEEFKWYLSDISSDKTVVMDKSVNTAGVVMELENKGIRILDSDLGVILKKSIKNETEIANIRKYYKEDNKIVTEFIKYIKNNDVTQLNEFDLANKLDSMRLACPDCFDLSFDTISASGPNGAMMHYEATESNNSLILKDTLYLVDSGGQWTGATTDITRTVVIGKPTYEMKHDYTRVIRGLLNLSNAIFMQGITGVNLDVLARAPMWEEGDDYKCGTGHGIGYILSVHEGPNAFRWKSNSSDAVLKPGMIMSCEPGIYKEGKYGIRIENILLVKEKMRTDDGVFLCFECLTYVPFDMDLILREEMSEKENKWLDEYIYMCNNQ